jgi:hypothetical protein
VVGEDCRARRRAEHAGGTDPLADEGVDQCRLAGPRRAADHGEHRGVDAAQPGQHIVLELVDDLLPQHPGGGDVGHLQRQGQLAQLLAQPVEGGEQDGGVRSGGHAGNPGLARGVTGTTGTSWRG